MFPMQFSGILPHPETTTKKPNGGNGHFLRGECVNPFMDCGSCCHPSSVQTGQLNLHPGTENFDLYIKL